VKTFQLM